MGHIRRAYEILFGKPEGKRQIERPTCRCKSIKMNYKLIGL
jgi:hypothetical protein